MNMKKRIDFLFIEKNDDIYTISMTPELQDDVGTAGFVEFTIDDTLEADDSMVNIEASKTVLELNTPLAGKIVERNEAAISEPELLNSAEPTENWIIKRSDVNEAQCEQLEDAESTYAHRKEHI